MKGNGYLFVKKDCGGYIKYTIGNQYSNEPTTSWTKINSLSNIVKIAAGKYHVIALDGDGTVFVWGSNVNKELTTAIPTYQENPIELKNISKK